MEKSDIKCIMAYQLEESRLEEKYRTAEGSNILEYITTMSIPAPRIFSRNASTRPKISS